MPGSSASRATKRTADNASSDPSTPMTIRRTAPIGCFTTSTGRCAWRVTPRRDAAEKDDRQRAQPTGTGHEHVGVPSIGQTKDLFASIALGDAGLDGREAPGQGFRGFLDRGLGQVREAALKLVCERRLDDGRWRGDHADHLHGCFTRERESAEGLGRGVGELRTVRGKSYFASVS